MSIAGTAAATLASPGKYLTVALGPETYGIPVLKVREIIRLQKITPVPNTPAHVKGVINLRGRVIAIVDLRAKFGIDAAFAERTCIVVVQVRLPNEQAVSMGVIVDSVDEVVNLAAADIEPTPDFGSTVDTGSYTGMAKVKGRVMTLLDLDKVVGADAAQTQAEAQARAAAQASAA